MPAYVIGYDPGGDGSHGLAALSVEQRVNRWVPAAVYTTTAHSLSAAVAWAQRTCGSASIVAIGIDTLTEWSSDPGGWRAADRWLRTQYPTMARSIVAPNSIYGSMVMSGAGFLMLMADRIRLEGAAITEAHPKLAYFALTGQRPHWQQSASEMCDWLSRELEADLVDVTGLRDDHAFDASMAALAALRGLNGEWTRDLHALGEPDTDTAVRFFGRTHYWWPE